MGKGTWIGGILGYIVSGPLGALAGALLSTIIESVGGSILESLETGTERGDGRQDPAHRNYEGERNSLLFSMLVLASYIIRSDGKVMHSEMELVRKFLRDNFGERALPQAEEILRALFDRQKEMERISPGAFQRTISECAQQIASQMPYEQRLQLLAFLLDIAKADGSVDSKELRATEEVARMLGISDMDTDSMLSLGKDSLESAYRVLGIPSTASDEQVRQAYRAMALKHHPDKVASLGEDIRQAAEKKFQEIGQARDMIFKARGLN